MHIIQDNDGAVLVTRIGRGWLQVPRDSWDAFTAAVRRGDYDTPTPPPRAEPRPGASLP